MLPESFLDLANKDISKLSNILQGDNITNQLKSSYQSHTKSRVIKCFDYKNFTKLGKVISVFQSYNVFHAKCISQSYTYIIQILSALANRNNLGFSHYSKS